MVRRLIDRFRHWAEPNPRSFATVVLILVASAGIIAGASCCAFALWALGWLCA